MPLRHAVISIRYFEQHALRARAVLRLGLRAHVLGHLAPARDSSSLWRFRLKHLFQRERRLIHQSRRIRPNVSAPHGLGMETIGE